MEYSRLFEALYKSDIKYLICGGLAVNIYGIPRMTADIDLIIEFEKENIDTFLKIIKTQDYHQLIPVPLTELLDPQKRKQLVDEKNLIAYSFYNSNSAHMNLDVIVDFPETFENLWSRKEIRNIDNFKVNLLSLEDLIMIKEKTKREQDREDVKLLSKILNEKKGL
ncbi:MAG: nucleotidyltransferase [Bacteroidota bacterium]